MSKPTSGPWSVEIIKGSYQRPALVVAGDKLVAQCMGNQLDPSATSIGEATANAHLIAAAPEMLDELKRQFKEEGVMRIGTMVHRIDPSWPNPWRDGGNWNDYE